MTHHRRSSAHTRARPKLGLVLLLATLTTLAACSSSRSSMYEPSNSPRPTARVASQSSGFSPTSLGVSASVRPAAGSTASASSYKIGKPYRIGGIWYVPREDPTYDRSGVGSWYGADFHGRKTANGEIYDMHALTAAHPTLPLPSYVDVTNLANNKTVRVRVNDRGPYIAGRIIDMSQASARQLGFETQGKAQLRVRYVGRAPLNGTNDRIASRPLRPFYGLGAASLATLDHEPNPIDSGTTHQQRRALAQQRVAASR